MGRQSSVGLAAEGGIRLRGTSAARSPRSGTLAIHLRRSLTIESRRVVVGPDNLPPVFHDATWPFNRAAEP